MDKAILKECSQLSLDGNITFPEVVSRLRATGVERYYADLVRMEKVYYSADGDTFTVALSLSSQPKISSDFNKDGVRDAVKTIQKGAINYQEFLKRIMANGAVSYAVFITADQTTYFGRKGEEYVEQFKPAAASAN